MNDTSEIAILIDEFIRNPIGYHDEYLEKLIERKDFTKQHLFHLLNKLCSSQNGPIINKSGASRGTIGYLNRRSQKRRNEVFDKKLKSGFRSNSNNKVILAEGDSWFEYPIFIREILDYLTASRHSDYAIYSVAHGSDWLSNMIYENQYIEQIQHLSPDVFLISGGGNDLVGKMRIIEMIEAPLKKPIYNDEFYADRSRRSQIYKIHSRVQFDEDKYNLGVEHLNKEFFRLIKSFKLQYTLIFHNMMINYDRFYDLKIITQGYDYVIPSSKLGLGFNPFKLHKPISNIMMGNGKWLAKPLMAKGIQDPYIQESILYAMIFEFNEMLLAVAAKFDNVYHIDCRGLNNAKTWYNELHPESTIFKTISKAYEICIDGKIKDKHIIVNALIG